MIEAILDNQWTYLVAAIVITLACMAFGNWKAKRCTSNIIGKSVRREM